MFGTNNRLSGDLKVIECPVYDPINDFRRDPTGVYVLIRCDIEKALIEVAICDKKHTIIKVFQGRKAQDLYALFLNMKRNFKMNWFSRKDHIAYLGKELKKVNLA